MEEDEVKDSKKQEKKEETPKKKTTTKKPTKKSETTSKTKKVADTSTKKAATTNSTTKKAATTNSTTKKAATSKKAGTSKKSSAETSTTTKKATKKTTKKPSTDKEQPEKTNKAEIEVAQTKQELSEKTEKKPKKVKETKDVEVVEDTVHTEENPQITEFERSKFDGGLLQLIGWRLLGFFVTLFTLGLGYPFALCFIYKWQMKHTTINGKQLTFDGKGYQLLGRWILWVLLSIITLGIYTLWIPVQKNRWIIKHTHYKDTVVTKENNQSQFTGTTLQYIGWLVLGIIITIFSFGLLYPCALCLIYNWRIGHTVIDGDDMEFDGKSLQFWGLWIKWILLSIITLGIYSLWIPISLIKWETKHTNKKGLSSRPYSVTKAIIIPILIVILVIALIAGLGGYIFSRNQNIFKQLKDDFESVEKQVTQNYNKEIYLKVINEYSDGVAWVEGEDDIYLIDKDGNIIYKIDKPEKFYSYQFNEFKNGYAKIKDDEDVKIIDKKGNTILEQDEDQYDEIDYTNDGFAIVKIKEENYLGRTEKIGVINLKTNQFSLQPSEEYKNLQSLGEGMFKYRTTEGKYVLVNAENGKKLEEESSENFINQLQNYSNGYSAKLINRSEGTYGLVNKECEKIIIRTGARGSDNIGDFGDGLIYIDGAFYEGNGNKSFDLVAENVNNTPKFVDGYALVTFYNGNKNYFTTIDKTGKFMFEPKEYISTSNVIDKETFAIYENQKELYPGGYIICREKNRWAILDSKAKTVLQLEQDVEPKGDLGKEGILAVHTSSYKNPYYIKINGDKLEIKEGKDKVTTDNKEQNRTTSSNQNKNNTSENIKAGNYTLEYGTYKQHSDWADITITLNEDNTCTYVGVDPSTGTRNINTRGTYTTKTMDVYGYGDMDEALILNLEDGTRAVFAIGENNNFGSDWLTFSLEK